jgi:hypothetical protein
MEKRAIKIIFFALPVILFVLVYSFFFYSSDEGLKSVYRASYDWKIDFLAILSGLSIISISCYLYYTKKINFILFSILLFSGTGQSMMHISKWLVRIYFT